MSLFIAWSFVFWNGSLLGGAVQSGASLDIVFLLQGAAAACAALCCALGSGLLLRPARCALMFGGCAGCASCATVFAGLGAIWHVPGLAVAGFALSGVGSTLFIGWQRQLGSHGVRRAAGLTGLSYVLGLGEFLVVSFLPALVLIGVAAALPLGSFALLSYGEYQVDADTRSESFRLRERIRVIPWRLPAIVAIGHFCYGVTRLDGIVVSHLSLNVGQVLEASVPIACCLAGVMLAYVAYRRNAMAGLYVAFPMLALGCLLDLGRLAGGDIVTFGLVNVGSELVRHLTWFLMIDVIVKDGASALLCLAVLRVAHWGGCTLGQVAAGILGLGSVLSGVAVVLLMAGIFAILGVDTLFRARAREQAAGRRAGACHGERCGLPSSLPEGAVQETRSAPSFGNPSSEVQPSVNVPDPTAGEPQLATNIDPASRGASWPGSPQKCVMQVAERFGLSPRETEVLTIWVTGRALSYVEKALFISRSTVKTHLNHIYAKTGTANREELIELVAGEIDSVPLG